MNEIIILVNIALGNAGTDLCPAGDIDRSGTVSIDEILKAVHNALNGCPF